MRSIIAVYFDISARICRKASSRSLVIVIVLVLVLIIIIVTMIAIVIIILLVIILVRVITSRPLQFGAPNHVPSVTG